MLCFITSPNLLEHIETFARLGTFRVPDRSFRSWSVSTAANCSGCWSCNPSASMAYRTCWSGTKCCGLQLASLGTFPMLQVAILASLGTYYDDHRKNARDIPVPRYICCYRGLSIHLGIDFLKWVHCGGLSKNGVLGMDFGASGAQIHILQP